ncbi:hypothetical protein [Paenibacillus sp. RC67]|nr:hypothetical protein [Paenibacillus sp. RC67]
MFPPISLGSKGNGKGNGFGKFEILLQLNEQLRTSTTATAPAK